MEARRIQTDKEEGIYKTNNLGETVGTSTDDNEAAKPPRVQKENSRYHTHTGEPKRSPRSYSYTHNLETEMINPG